MADDRGVKIAEGHISGCVRNDLSEGGQGEMVHKNLLRTARASKEKMKCQNRLWEKNVTQNQMSLNHLAMNIAKLDAQEFKGDLTPLPRRK